MADLSSLLAVIEHDPDDAQALEAIVSAANAATPEVRATRFAASRKLLSGRGRPDAIVALIDIELAASREIARQVDLLLEKALVLDGELLDVPAARATYAEVTQLRPDDAIAKEALDELAITETNWEKFAAKYLKESQCRNRS